jgi:hypothetical protein
LVDPAKKARYVEETEYDPEEYHLHTKRSGCSGCKITDCSSSQTRR